MLVVEMKYWMPRTPCSFNLQRLTAASLAQPWVCLRDGGIEQHMQGRRGKAVAWFAPSFLHDAEKTTACVRLDHRCSCFLDGLPMSSSVPSCATEGLGSLLADSQISNPCVASPRNRGSRMNQFLESGHSLAN
jgi:hypothetical protein